jgi:PAS domain S-box-containing protein
LGAAPLERILGGRLEHREGFTSALIARGREVLRSPTASRHGIGARLLIGVLLISCLVTIILTALQLYADYRRDVAEVESRLEQIDAAGLDSLAEGLWNLDERQLRLQLDALLRLPDIRGVEIRETGSTDKVLFKLSRTPEDPTFAREYPLHYSAQGQDRVIGTLRVEATLAGVYRRLAKIASTILVTQAATIFLVSLFIFYFFHHLLTRHLSAIAADVGSHRIKDAPLELHLRRRPPRHEDELQRVVTAFNAMSHNLYTAYHDLAEREARIRRLVDSNIIGIFVWNIDGLVIEANDAFLQMVGYDREDLASGRVNRADMTPPEWRERDARTVAEARATGTVQPFEKEYFRKDGSRVPVLIGVTSFDDNRDQGVAFVLELTERKRAEAELRESEQNYRMLFESIDEGFCTIEVLFDQNEKPVDYRFLKISPSFEQQTGIKNAAGKRMREIAPEHEENWFEIYGRIALTGEPIRFESEAKQLGRWYDVYAFRVEDPKRRRVGILFNDITERKGAEAEARDSERRYRELEAELAHATRLATMGELTASIAHEMKQPITSSILNAKAALSWLDRPTPELDEVRQALGGVINNGNRASDVIERIGDLVKKAPPRRALLEINGAIREVIELTHGEAVKDGVAVEMRLSEELPLIEGDRVQLQQVILNLIINAIQAMSATSDGSRQLLITTVKANSGDVLVAVEDTGPGLTSEALQHIFQPFVTTKPGGLGLGLSICRSIIEAHGGRLWASSNEPRGAIFQFTVPAHPNGA